MMDDFEKQIQDALARKEPSPFFEARVLGAVKRQARDRRASMRMWWATVAAALAVSVFFGLGHVYEGGLAVFQTALLGLYFTAVFLARRRLRERFRVKCVDGAVLRDLD